MPAGRARKPLLEGIVGAATCPHTAHAWQHWAHGIPIERVTYALFQAAYWDCRIIGWVVAPTAAGCSGRACRHAGVIATHAHGTVGLYAAPVGSRRCVGSCHQEDNNLLHSRALLAAPRSGAAGGITTRQGSAGGCIHLALWLMAAMPLLASLRCMLGWANCYCS